MLFNCKIIEDLHNYVISNPPGKAAQVNSLFLPEHTFGDLLTCSVSFFISLDILFMEGTLDSNDT